MSEIKVGEFIKNLWNAFLEETGGKQMEISALLHYGRTRFWLEDQDKVQKDSVLTKRTAARIVHHFMNKELNFSDLKDIHQAEILKDLYTCRVCANSIAQVYLRGLMTGEEIEVNGETAEIFNMLESVSESSAEEIILKLKKLEK